MSVEVREKAAWALVAVFAAALTGMVILGFEGLAYRIERLEESKLCP